jgi:Ca2+-binding EF-hand superfamily protein
MLAGRQMLLQATKVTRVSHLLYRTMADWTASQTEDVLVQHEDIVDASVRDKDGARVVHACSVKMCQGRGVFVEMPDAVDSETLLAWIQSEGYKGPELKVRMVSTDTLELQDHRRVTLSHLTSAIFDDADADGDGGVTIVELDDFIQRHGLSIDVQTLFYAGEADGDYELNRHEFKRMLLETNLLARGDGRGESFKASDVLLEIIAKEMFRKGDADSSGTISKGELRDVFEAYRLEVEDFDSKFEAVDEDGDGSVSLQELQTMMVEKGVVGKPPEEEEMGAFAKAWKDLFG